MRLSRPLKWTLAALALTAGLGAVFRADIAMALAKRVAQQKLAANAADQLADGLHVGLCGAGSPFPDDRRSGPCTLVIAGKLQLVFDAGSGASRNIGKMGFNQGHVRAIFLTHFHSDHIDGLGELLLQRWLGNSNRTPVPIYGPDGVEQVVAGLMTAYAQDQHYRVEHHGGAVVPASGFGGVAHPFASPPGQGTVVFYEDGVQVTAFLVDHAPVHPAVGYRVVYKDRSVVLSGDTRRSDAVQRQAHGADLLVHEALSRPLIALLQEAASSAGRTNLRKLFGDIVDYHATAEDAADTASAANVRFLLLNHIVPTLPAIPGMETVFLGDAANRYHGPIRVGIDGDFISLPAGSRDIQVGNRL